MPKVASSQIREKRDVIPLEPSVRAPSSRVKKTPEKFEFGAQHVLFSVSTKKCEDKKKNCKYQKVFKEKEKKNRKEKVLKEMKHEVKRLRKLDKKNKITIKSIQTENRKLRKMKLP